MEKQVEPYHPEYAANRVKSALERAEKELQQDMMRWFADLLADLTGVEKLAKDEPLPGFILARLNNQTWWQIWSERLAELLTNQLLSIMQIGSQTAERQLEMRLSWDYIQPAALEWTRQNAGKLVVGILPDVQMGISQLVTTGLGEGKTMYQIRDEIAGLQDDEGQTVFPQWRATRIARTEVIRAHAQGAKISYQESGVVRGMRWLDGQTAACPKCKALHNKTIRLGEKFYNDPKFGDGLPPRHPHCRCAVAPVTLEQVKYLPADHPLRNNRRNSIEEVTDIQAYTEIGGIRVSGERLRHAQVGHPEVKNFIGNLEQVVRNPTFFKNRGELRDYYLDLKQRSPSGRNLYLKAVVKMDENPFLLTSYLTTRK